MGQVSKGVAWICIFSTFLLGCYSSSLIDPNGGAKEKMYSGKIESVILKDGREYL